MIPDARICAKIRSTIDVYIYIYICMYIYIYICTYTVKIAASVAETKSLHKFGYGPLAKTATVISFSKTHVGGP